MITLTSLIKLRGKNCYWCGSETILANKTNRNTHNAATREHLVPKAHGGSDHTDNLAVACFLCNTNRQTMPEEEFRASKFLQHRLGYLFHRTPEIERRTIRNRKKRQKKKERHFHRKYIQAIKENVARNIAKEIGKSFEEILTTWQIQVVV